MADESHPTHLSPSELGTKEYWETFYARTLAHISTKHNPTTSTSLRQQSQYQARAGDKLDSEEEEDSDSDRSDEDADDDSDPGTSWFSEHNAPDKVLQFLTGEEFPLAPCNTRRKRAMDYSNDSLEGGKEQEEEERGKDKWKVKDEQPSILDLGTGNGSMLALLRKRGGFRGEMVGVDYSVRSVELARELQRLKIHSAYLSDDEDEYGFDSSDEEDGVKEEKEEMEIRFEEWDILHSEDDLSGTEGKRLDWFPYEKGGFDIVLDKGTFDAVSLSDQTVESEEATSSSGKKIERRVCEQYPGIARRLVRQDGFLVVTSCNWTEEELIQWFTRTDRPDTTDRLVVWGKVEYPRFRFGGREGQGVCTVCFQRIIG